MLEDNPLAPLGYINVRKPVDFSAPTFCTGERKPVGQFWLFDKLNLRPTVEAGYGCIGLLDFGHTKGHRAPITESKLKVRLGIGNAVPC